MLIPDEYLTELVKHGYTTRKYYVNDDETLIDSWEIINL